LAQERELVGMRVRGGGSACGAALSTGRSKPVS
jgi:hypothetical protein